MANDEDQPNGKQHRCHHLKKVLHLNHENISKGATNHGVEQFELIYCFNSINNLCPNFSFIITQSRLISKKRLWKQDFDVRTKPNHMLQSIFSFNASSSIASISWNKSGLAIRKARLFLGGEEKRLERNRPPQNVKVAQGSQRQFGPIFEAGQQGLLNCLLSVTRPLAQLILAAV